MAKAGWPFTMLLRLSVNNDLNEGLARAYVDSIGKAIERTQLDLLTVLVQPSTWGEAKESRVGYWEGICLGFF